MSVCVGTNCYVKGSQRLLHGLVHHVEEEGLQDLVDIRAAFCTENCGLGPTVMIEGEKLSECTLEKALSALRRKVQECGGKPQASPAAPPNDAAASPAAGGDD
jgi:NADH-quinone oxidoreductase subunit G